VGTTNPNPQAFLSLDFKENSIKTQKRQGTTSVVPIVTPKNAWALAPRAFACLDQFVVLPFTSGSVQ
jgi:hypothetical protein